MVYIFRNFLYRVALNNLKRNNQANWNEFSKDLTNALIDPSGQFDAKSIIREYANQLDSQFEGQKGLSKLLSNMEDIIPRQELYKILKYVEKLLAIVQFLWAQ